jgi:hypothetical protein
MFKGTQNKSRRLGGRQTRNQVIENDLQVQDLNEENAREEPAHRKTISYQEPDSKFKQ